LSQQVGVYDTSAGESSIVAQTPISLTGASELRSLTASNNGSQMLVADDMAHHLSILNTLSGGLTVVTSAEGLNNAADDTFDVGVGPQAVPTLGISPDDEYAYVANAGSDNVQVVDANPASATFGHVLSSGGTITFAGGPYLPGARAVKVAPTFNVGTPGTPVRQTHGYVVRDFSQEVCVFDAEPSSATFLTQIAAANSPNADNCINLGLAGAVYPLSLDVSPDGLYAFVTVSTGLLEIIDTNPNDTSTFETVIATFNLSGLSTACAQPMGTRVSPDGQTAWVACTDSGQLIGLSTALVNTTQFGLADTLTTPSSGTSIPENVAFRPDGAFGLASLNGTGFVLPFSAVGVGTGLNSSGTPLGIDHVPNAVLHVTTSALPAATNGEAYQSSVVAAGPNGFFTFTDVTPASPGPTLAALGLTLTSYGEIVGTPTTPGNYTFYIQVSDRSQPVNNVVVNAITLTVN
jgi:DNA-binding beta-propeller fold protein YncE